jgi:serine/threonine protein kinase
MAHVLTKEVVPPIEKIPDIPRIFNDLLLKCLAKDPAQRPQSADEVALILEQLLAAHGPPESHKGTTPSAAWKRPEAGIAEMTPPTFQQGGTDRLRRTSTHPDTSAASTPTKSAPGSASWKRPEGKFSTPASSPFPQPPMPTNTPTQPAPSVPPLVLGIIITLGVLIVVLLVILILKK